jgi:hypothetical protein
MYHTQKTVYSVLAGYGSSLREPWSPVQRRAGDASWPWAGSAGEAARPRRWHGAAARSSARPSRRRGAPSPLVRGPFSTPVLLLPTATVRIGGGSGLPTAMVAMLVPMGAVVAAATRRRCLVAAAAESNTEGEGLRFSEAPTNRGEGT